MSAASGEQVRYIYKCAPPKPVPKHNRAPKPPTIYYGSRLHSPAPTPKPVKIAPMFRAEMGDKWQTKIARLRLAQGDICADFPSATRKARP